MTKPIETSPLVYMNTPFTGENKCPTHLTGHQHHRLMARLDGDQPRDRRAHVSSWELESYPMLGNAIGASGLVKHKRVIPGKEAALIKFLKNTSGIALCKTKIRLQRLFLGNELFDALERDMHKVFTYKAWQRPVWFHEHWFVDSPFVTTHSLHVSATDPTLVAYADTPAKLIAERYTRVKPGRYLQKFFGDYLSKGDIKSWSERQAARGAPLTVKYIENNDPDGWVHVYANGPDSCMHGETAVRVYAYPKNDLRLAYAELDGKIVARAIVRCSHGSKGYIRIYPNPNSDEELQTQTKMKEALEKAGYVDRVSMDGAKIAREHNDMGFVCPFIDSASTGEDCGDYIRLYSGSGGEFDVQTTSGYIEHNPGTECDDCGDTVDEDDITYVEYHDRHVCGSCCNENYVSAHVRQARCTELVRRDDCVLCESDDEWYHQEYLDRHGVRLCMSTGDYWHEGDMRELPNGDWAHEDECSELTPDFYEGETYALDDDTVEDHEGRTVLRTDCIRDRDGEWWHWDDLEEARQMDLELETEGEAA